MARFAGHRYNNIYIISDESFVNDELSIIRVPAALDDYSAQDIIKLFRIRQNRFIAKKDSKTASEMKVALISNYGEQCGIGTYSKFLYQELIKLVGDFRLFTEKSVQVKNELDTIPTDKIIPCWKRGESLMELVDQVKLYDPDIILIQHEFGIWPNARYWLSMLNQLSEYRIIVTMHSVFYHKDKVIAEAGIPEIVVHLEGAKEVLKEVKKLSSKVYVIPHGCFPCVDRSKLWNFYKSDYTFVQFGFLFKYKGYENSIKATAILKKKYPNVFFTGLCSESEFAKQDHDVYYNELIGLISSLDLEDNVGLIRGYQSDDVLNSYLRINKAAVFPYVSNQEHECFGSSGAAPYTMTKGIPVITSSIHHFASLPTIKADTPEEIAVELDKIFTDKKYAERQVDQQVKYLEDNSWEIVAKKYVSIFENTVVV